MHETFFFSEGTLSRAIWIAARMGSAGAAEGEAEALPLKNLSATAATVLLDSIIEFMKFSSIFLFLWAKGSGSGALRLGVGPKAEFIAWRTWSVALTLWEVFSSEGDAGATNGDGERLRLDPATDGELTLPIERRQEEDDLEVDACGERSPRTDE